MTIGKPEVFLTLQTGRFMLREPDIIEKALAVAGLVFLALVIIDYF